MQNITSIAKKYLLPALAMACAAGIAVKHGLQKKRYKCVATDSKDRGLSKIKTEKNYGRFTKEYMEEFTTLLMAGAALALKSDDVLFDKFKDRTQIQYAHALRSDILHDFTSLITIWTSQKYFDHVTTDEAQEGANYLYDNINEIKNRFIENVEKMSNLLDERENEK